MENQNNGQQANIATQPANTEIALMQAKMNAEFAMTPVGQCMKQFEVVQRIAQAFCASTMVPKQYQATQDNPNAIANCIVAVNMAVRMNADPMMIMQNLYVVNGNPSFSSKFLIASVNQCGRFTPLRYECNGKRGDEYGWRCVANDNKGNVLEGDWITWKMVKAEQWDSKKGSKWQSMPEQMFRYRAAAFWQRAYAPEISMGFISTEEARDIEDVDAIIVRDNTIAENANKTEIAEPEQKETVKEAVPASAPEDGPNY